MGFNAFSIIKQSCRKDKLWSYFKAVWNRVDYEGYQGGVFLKWSGDIPFKKQGGIDTRAEYNCIVNLVEDAKLDWQFSAKLLDETTDPDLMDYVIYLIKSNEARYRYLLKLARRECAANDSNRKSMTI